MAGTLFENNLSPYLTIVESTEPAAPSAGQQRLYIDSTTHLLKATNSSGTDRTIEGVPAGAITTSGLTMATARLLGRTTASSGAVEEITVGSGLSLSAGSLTATGGASSPWDLIADENGTSFTNWANDISTYWSSDATDFIANPGTGNTAKMRYTSALIQIPCRIDLEVFFDSTGASQAGGHLFVMGLGSSSNPSNAAVGGFKFVSNNPAANGQAYAEKQGAVAYPGTAHTFALDTWLSVTVITNGIGLSISMGGAVVWNIPLIAADGTCDSLIIIAYQTKVKVRNVKAYQLTAP